jgi:hypothetical protein
MSARHGSGEVLTYAPLYVIVVNKDRGRTPDFETLIRHRTSCAQARKPAGVSMGEGSRCSVNLPDV